jgi:tetratricopeptide (TPR) repeat protein
MCAMFTTGRPAVSWTLWLLSAAAGLGLSVAAAAECTPPPALQANLHAHPTVENAIAVGNWFASHQQFGCAVDVFRGALRSDPKSAQLHYLEGLALSGWGHTTEAIPELEEATRLEPGVLKPHLVLASLYQEAGRPADTEEQWKLALGIDAHSTIALESLSDALMARRDYKSVVGLLQSAPRTESLAVKLVQAYAQLNMLDAASQAATEALRLNPKSLSLANTESVILARQQRYEEAVKVLEEALTYHPNDRDAEFLFFRILVLTADIKRARPLGLKLLAQYPHDAEILYLNGVVDRSIGDYAQSKAHLEEAVKINPGFANSRFNLGIALVFLKEWPEAKEQLEKAIELKVAGAQVHYELARALHALGETDHANQELQIYQKQRKSEEDSVKAAMSASQVETDLARGKVTEAVSALEDSVRLDPKVLKPHLALARLYDETNRHTDAEEQWKQALAIDPNSIPALEGLSADLLARQEYAGIVQLLGPAPRTERLAIHLSQALGLLNNLDEARQVLTEALQLSPGSLPLADAMTVVLVKQVRYQEATKLLQQAVEQHPGDPEAELLLLRILVLTGDFQRAQPLAPKLLALRPHDPQVLYLNGVVERTTDNYTQAKAHLEESVALDPNFFNSRYDLGIVLDALHEWKEAKVQLEKAIEIGASQPEAHYELAKVLHSLGETDSANREWALYRQQKKSEEGALEAASRSSQGDSDLAAGNFKEAIEHYREASETQPDNAVYKFKLSVALDRTGDTDGEKAQLLAAVALDPTHAAAQNQLGYLLSRSGDIAGASEHFRLAVRSAPGWAEAWINYAATLAGQAHIAEARDAVATALRLEPQNAEARELSNQLDHDPAGQQAHP